MRPTGDRQPRHRAELIWRSSPMSTSSARCAITSADTFGELQATGSDSRASKPKNPRRLLPAALVLAGLLVQLAFSGTALATEKTTFFSLASGARALAITDGPDGNLWFAGIRYAPNFSGDLGRITPAGQVAEFPLPAEGSGELEASGIVAGPDGSLWFTESGASKIGRITTAGAITEFPLASGSKPSAITVGPDGNLWFTEEAANRIGRITTAGAITEFSLPSGSGPAGIVAGADGNLWFTEKSANRIGRITTAGTVTGFPLPGAASKPNAITVGPDGNLWFTEEAAYQVGRITTAGAITEFPVPVKTGTGAIATGPAGDLWFTAGREIGSISPNGQTAQPSCVAAGCRLPPSSLVAGPEGNLWFGADTEITEGGGGGAIQALYAPGLVGEFFPPPLTVAIEPSSWSVAGRLTHIRLSCKGGAADTSCEGVVQLTVRIPKFSADHSRGTKTLILSHRRYDVLSDAHSLLPLRLSRKAARLLLKNGSMSVRATATSQGGTYAIQSVALHLRGWHKRSRFH